MFLKLLRIELLKLKRSQALLMTLLCPLSVVLLQLMMVVESGGKKIAEQGWGMYWLGTVSLWYMLMMPLYIALVTTLINSVDHKNKTWRLMATMPITKWQLFISKFTVSWLFVLAASLILYVLTSLSIGLMVLIGYQAQNAFNPPLLSHLPAIMVASLPIIVIGHALSWHFKSIVMPLSVGVVMTMSAMTISRSEQYWQYDLWTYPTVATLVSDKTTNSEAWQYGLIIGLVMLAVATWRFGKVETRD